MKIYGKEFTKDEIRQRIGDISQIAGIKPYKLKEGRMDGVDAFDIKTGSGFNFTVLPGRAMDIGWADYCGKSIGYITKSGMSGSAHYVPQGFEWLRNFNGGVLTTCGLTHVGGPENDGKFDLGVHGRISNIPASEVGYKTYFDGDELVMKVEGSMREAVIFSENLVLTRSITAYGGQNRLIIEDTIENQGYEEAPLMVMYHMNFGFPLVSEDSRLIGPILDTTPATDLAKAELRSFDKFIKPEPSYSERLYLHGVSGDEEGNTEVGIVNEAMKFGMRLKYNTEQLPYLTEWKLMSQQDYVVGVEPGNCTPIGRKAASESGMLEMLQPGEIKRIKIELEILASEDEIREFVNNVDKLKSMTSVDNEE